MTTLAMEACRMAIKTMMAKGWLDICTIDKVLAMTGGVPEGGADYDSLRLLHCVSFKDYSQTMRIEVLKTLERVLSSPSMEVEVRFKPLSRITTELTIAN